MILPFLFATLPVLATGDADPSRVKLPAPSVNYRTNVATATSAPWVEANGWRILRSPDQKVVYDARKQGANLSAAEAFAYGADAEVLAGSSAHPEFEAFRNFLQSLPPFTGKRVADFSITDDKSPQAGEALNLLVRRNLLFQIVPSKEKGLVFHADRNVSNPYEFAAEVRSKIGDEKRSLRVYGSSVVVGHLERNGNRMRVHLLNYGQRPVDAIRVRVLGNYSGASAHIFQVDPAKLEDMTTVAGATEFTVPKLPLYGMIDLTAK